MSNEQSGAAYNREPTNEEAAGIAWWNGMPDHERAHWAKRAGTGVAADAWQLYKASQYRLEVPGLQDAVTATKPDAKHAALMRAVRAAPDFQEARLARIDDSGNTYLVRRKVLRPDGSLVHDDHWQWLSEELAADAGQAATTRRRLAALDLRLSKCSVATLRIVVDRGGDQANFVQATVEQLTEVVDRRLFDTLGGWGMPRDLRELANDAEGPEVPEAERQPVGQPRYQLREVIDVGAFVRVTQQLHRENAIEFSRKRLSVSVVRGQEPQREQMMSGAELDPDWDRYPCRERRIFDDWTMSSAGLSGARICEHWTFQVSDAIDKVTGQAERWMSFVPEWATTRKLAKLNTRNLNDYEVFGKLQAMDERLGVPFGWYFFMLHGNRVQSSAAERVLEAAEAGSVVLPEHDYRVLKHWANRQYGF